MVLSLFNIDVLGLNNHMSETFVFSKVYPLNSIINPDTSATDYLDFQTPFSFFDYLKYTKLDLTPSQIAESYTDYVKAWHDAKTLDEVTKTESIRDRYVELIKQITLKYTTTEEKRFLANINYDDPLDLDIVIPFYSRKVVEICNFYSEKRQKLKFKIEKNKIKGTPNSLERSIFENIVDVLFTDELGVGEYQRLVNTTELLADLSIEIEELYDFYSSYLDNDPDKIYSDYEVTTQARKDLYSSNINKIDYNIFTNTDQGIRNQIFEGIRIFLKEFGKRFTIDYDLTKVNLNCKSNDPLYDLVNAKKDDAKIQTELRYKLIEKYIGSDFYYIQTGDTISDVLSGKLFTAQNPTGNLLNRHFPTTASVEEESELESCRRVGLFFTPEKTSILYFSTPEKKYKVDSSKLEPNKVYIFPDPDRYGNTTGLTKSYFEEYPLIHIQDYSSSLKNKSTFSSEGDIDSDPFKQDFYSYWSRNQLSLATGNDQLSSNLSRLYDIGILTKYSTDIYGNQYGLFKAKSRKNLEDNTIALSGEKLILRRFDGGPLTWERNGLLPDPVATTNPNWVYPNVWASNYYYNISLEGGVGGYNSGIMNRGLYDRIVVDGLYGDRTGYTFDIRLNDLTPSDPVVIDGLNYTTDQSTLTGYELNTNLNSFAATYDFIIDGNSFNRTPSTLATPATNVLDGNSLGNISELAASFTNDYILSSIQYRTLDGGYLTDNPVEDYNFTDRHHIEIEQILSKSQTVSSTPDTDDEKNSYDIRKGVGTIYVRNVLTGIVLPLSSALSVQFDKYTDSVKSELYSEVLDFGIYNNLIWIKTTNHLVIEKIDFDSEDGFVYSGTSNHSLSFGLSSYHLNITDPFFFEDRIYGMIATVELSGTISNSFYVVPRIYKFNYSDCNISEIYPDSITSLYQNNSSTNPVRLVRVNTPKLCYNSRNNKYGVVSILEDSNEFPYIWRMIYDYNGSEVSNEEIKLYTCIGDEKFRTFNTFDTPLFSDASTVYQNISNISLIQSSDYIRLG